MNQLERDFKAALLRDAKECRELGYNPTEFLRMIEDYSAVEATRRVIMDHAAHKAPYGFTKLWELGRLDLTVEEVILYPQWFPLFDQEVRDRAAARLKYFR